MYAVASRQVAAQRRRSPAPPSEDLAGTHGQCNCIEASSAISALQVGRLVAAKRCYSASAMRQSRYDLFDPALGLSHGVTHVKYAGEYKLGAAALSFSSALSGQTRVEHDKRRRSRAPLQPAHIVLSMSLLPQEAARYAP